MNTRTLGQTDIAVTPIGLGCWQFASPMGPMSFWQPLDQELINQIVAAAIDHGINWFDSAEAYGWGRSERRLSIALAAAGQVPNAAPTNRSPGGSDRVAIATKWFPGLRLARNIPRSIIKRVSALDPFGIDLYQIHNPYSFASIPSMMDALASLCERGIIRAVGVSNFSAAQMRRAHAELLKRGVPLASNQVHYNLLHRNIESNGILDTAKELGVTIIAYSSLAQGVLTGAFHNDPEKIRRRPGPRKWMPQFRPDGLSKSQPLIDALRSIGKQRDKSVAQMALAWLVKDESVVAIPGASSAEQAVQNAGALEIALTDGEYQEISAAAAAASTGA